MHAFLPEPVKEALRKRVERRLEANEATRGAATPVFFEFLALNWVGSLLSDEVRSVEGPSTDWALCFLAADECTRGAGPVFLKFLALDRVGRLLSDEASAEAGVSMGWVACSALFFAWRAALASSARFFFACSPMADKKQYTGTHVTITN